VGRYLYLDSVSNSSSEIDSSKAENSVLFGTETQKSYLAHAEYLVHTGLPEFVAFIREKVEKVLSAVPLQQQCSYEELLRLFLSIRNSVEDTNTPPPSGKDTHAQANLLYFLLPPEREISFSNEETEEPLGAYGEGDENLKMLLNETRNILESEAFLKVLKPSLNIAFLFLCKNLRSSFLPPPPSSVSVLETPSSSDTSSPTIVESKITSDATPTSPPSPSLVSYPMAKLLPSINKQLSVLLSHPQNEILSAIAETSQIYDFSYSLFTTSGVK